jgi:hypothetical protein
MPAKVLVVGDSHIAALSQGLARIEGRHPAQREFDVRVQSLGGGRLLIKPFSRPVADGVDVSHETPGKPELRIRFGGDLAAVGVCANFHSVRLLRRGGWDRFAPAEIAAGEYPLSLAVFREMMRADQQHILAFVDQVRAGTRVFAIESPAPFRHHPLLSEVRAELWSYVNSEFRKFVHDELAARGVDMIRIPREFMDDMGFMLPRFRSDNPDDRHHANALYGEHMMRLVLDYLGASLPEYALPA